MASRHSWFPLLPCSVLAHLKIYQSHYFCFTSSLCPFPPAPFPLRLYCQLYLFFSTLFCVRFCFFISLHHITVALILWPWINIIYQGRLMFPSPIQTGVTLAEKWHSTATGACVLGGLCFGYYVTISSAFQCLPFWPVACKQSQTLLRKSHVHSDIHVWKACECSHIRLIRSHTHQHPQESSNQVQSLPLIKAHQVTRSIDRHAGFR